MFIKKLTKQVICNPEEPVVCTPNGKLRGLIVDGTYIFRGIKYCEARRFHLPEPAKSWKGVKEAIIYGPVCTEIQTVQPSDNYKVPHVFYPQDAVSYTHLFFWGDFFKCGDLRKRIE